MVRPSFLLQPELLKHYSSCQSFGLTFLFLKMINKIVTFFSIDPRILNFIRRILENNFRAQEKIIEKYFSDKNFASILDIGCGTGEFSSYFKPANYIGIDLEKKYLDFAKKNHQGKFLLGDAKQLPFASKSFPKILMIGILHHLDDLDCAQALQEAKRVLAQNGKILLMEDIKSANDAVLTKIIHFLDQGKWIRTKKTYRLWLKMDFEIIKSFAIKSGLCPYQVFLLKKKDD